MKRYLPFQARSGNRCRTPTNSRIMRSSRASANCTWKTTQTTDTGTLTWSQTVHGKPPRLPIQVRSHGRKLHMENHPDYRYRYTHMVANCTWKTTQTTDTGTLTWSQTSYGKPPRLPIQVRSHGRKLCMENHPDYRYRYAHMVANCTWKTTQTTDTGTLTWSQTSYGKPPRLPIQVRSHGRKLHMENHPDYRYRCAHMVANCTWKTTQATDTSMLTWSQTAHYMENHPEY